MKLYIILCTVLALQFTYCDDMKRYDGYKTYRVNFKKEQIEVLRSIVEAIQGTEFFLFASGQGIADIFTSPKAEGILLKSLKENKFEYSLLNSNIQELIDEQS